MTSAKTSVLFVDRDDLIDMVVGKSFDEVSVTDFKSEVYKEMTKHGVVIFLQNGMARVLKNRYK